MNYGDVRNGVPFLEFDVPYSSICSKKKNREQYLFATFFPGSIAAVMVFYTCRKAKSTDSKYFSVQGAVAGSNPASVERCCS